MSLTALGTASYNGYTFSAYAETMRMSASFKYDGANRTIIYSEWTISIKERLFDVDGDIDNRMDTIYTQLGVPGGQFVYTGHGAGGFSINVSEKQDVKWGPKPLGIEERMMGRNKAREFIWTVVVCVPQMCLSPAYRNAIMAFNYSAEYNIDLLGYTTRTYTGYIEIPITRAGVTNRAIPDDADRYLESYLPRLPVDFRRTNRSHRVSPDRTRIDFSYVDEQLPPQGYQPGVAISDLRYSIRNEKPLFFLRWVSTLTGSYTMAQGVPRQLAMVRFFDLLSARLKFGYDNAYINVPDTTNANTDRPTKPGQGAIFPLNFQMTEDINEKSSGSFSFSYLMTCDLNLLLAATGMWTAVPNTNYNLWLASVGGTTPGTMMGQRGSAQLRHLPSDDVIIDLCVQPQVQQSGQSSVRKNNALRGIGLLAQKPPPETSFLDASIKIHVIADSNTLIAKQVPTSSFSANGTTGGGSGTGGSTGNGPGSGSDSGSRPLSSYLGTKLVNQMQMTGKPPNKQTEIIQQRTEPGIKFRIYGYITRAYYPIEAPLVRSFGGQPVVLLENDFMTETFGNGGMPYFHASFNQLYSVPTGNFRFVPIPPNPAVFTPSYNNPSTWQQVPQSQV